MRFKKVLLVNPFYSSYKFSIPVIPAGLGYLAESLSSGKIEYDILDMALGYNLRDLMKKIREAQPDLVGISMMTYMYNKVYHFIKEIKRNFPKIKIIVGGPHASSLREEILRECEEIDFAVTLEGERTLVELCQGKELNEIKGLLYREDGKIYFTGNREFARDLDSIPFPKYKGFEINKYGLGMSIVSSRGCPYRCIYCSCNVIGKTYRARNPRAVADEIEYWHKKGVREFGFEEDNPTFDKARMHRICDEIEKKNIKGLTLMCGNGARADRVDRELLRRMKEVGFKRLAFGCEAGNDRVLKSLRKGESIAVIEKAIKDACDLGFFVSLFFLVGSPGERSSDVEDSIKLALAYEISDVVFYNLVPMPDTELFDWIKKNDYFLTEPANYLNSEPFPSLSNEPVFATPEFPGEERRKALKRTKEVSRRIRQRLIERKLSGAAMLKKTVAFLYTQNFIYRLDRRLTANHVTRRMVGKLRNTARSLIYK